VRLTGVKSLAVELSVMAANVAVDAFGVTVSVASFVAVRETVATFDARPIWARAVSLPNRTRTAAPTTAFLRREDIAELRAKVMWVMYLRSTRAVPRVESSNER
jgi:hypothetical protein